MSSPSTPYKPGVEYTSMLTAAALALHQDTEGQGNCPRCEGQGIRTMGMSFPPDVKVPSDACHGARFNPERLAVTWPGKSIGDVLCEGPDSLRFGLAR